MRDKLFSFAALCENAPHSWIQGEAVWSLQVFGHQSDAVGTVKVARINALYRDLQDIELKVDPVHGEVLDIVHWNI